MIRSRSMHWGLVALIGMAMPALAHEDHDQDASTNGSGPAVKVEYVPSGQMVHLHEVIVEEGDTWLGAPRGPIVRYRFIMPAIARDNPLITQIEAEGDITYLCDTIAVPHLNELAFPDLHEIVITLSDRVVEWGESDPDATQYFEVFELNDGKCEWGGI